MTCIEKIYSVSALVGSGACNGNCKFCVGRSLRDQASEVQDSVTKQLKYEKNLESAIKLSARYGGWSLSLTSSGEPTCSPEDVTRALEIYNKCANQGAFFPNVNLFTNGILFGDKDFCREWLPQWKKLGLTNVVVSIHSTEEHLQAKAYGLTKYPNFSDIFNNIRYHGFGVRCTLLLSKQYVYDAHTYSNNVHNLINYYDIDNITSWPVGNPDGTRSEYTPSRMGLWSIKRWLKKNAILCHEHQWGDAGQGVFDYVGNILRLTDYVTKHDPKKDFVRQLVVFQDGSISYSWIRKGALCMK
jgi:sulfatase maturation enzyme AslB (radical SAM superfamily)